jgi:DNA-binding helix-hairpin-helix protein with protein kinase domain
MTADALLVDGQRITLGRRIGKGAEGEVYLLEGEDNLAIKIYTLATAEKLLAREEKIRAMLAANLASTTKTIAFPRSAVSDRAGRFRGFVMSAVRDHKPFHELYGPGSRKHAFPKADYKFLVRVATNIARSVAAVHHAGCVIGDVNHSGILISEKATVTLIDADSFQFEWNSKILRCEVGVPEYTPPEIQGKKFSEIVRSENHDCFGLAVVIFQLLLMGRHPFSGTPRRGDMLPLSEAIQYRKYAYSETRDVGLDQPPGTPAISELSSHLASLFDSAFTATTGNKRPTAVEWVSALTKFEAELQQCKRNKMHFAPPPIEECPWCEMETLANVILFIPPLSWSAGAPQVAGATVDLRSLVAQLNGISLPSRDRIIPKLPAYSPRHAAINSTAALSEKALKGLVLAVCVVAVAFLPSLWMLWIFLGYVGFKAIGDGDKSDRSCIDDIKNAHTNWANALISWQRKVGVDMFLQKKAEADASVAALDALSQSKQRDLQLVQTNRRAAQLSAFLDGFEIRKAKIKGIGRARLADLVSYGIETAADVERARLLAVPGFGEATAKPLLEWKASMERRFVFNPGNGAAERAETLRVEEKYRQQREALERAILASVADLARIRQQIHGEMARGDSTVESAFRALEDKKAEVTALNIQIPVLRITWPETSSGVGRAATTASAGVAPQSVPSPSQTAPTQSPGCPRCGSRMVRRRAKRGRNAGGSFWGCSRFPTCRGTRA